MKFKKLFESSKSTEVKMGDGVTINIDKKEEFVVLWVKNGEAELRSLKDSKKNIKVDVSLLTKTGTTMRRDK